MSKLPPPSDPPIENWRATMHRLNVIKRRRVNITKRQTTLENIMPYYVHNQPTVTPTKAAAVDATTTNNNTTTTTKSSLSTDFGEDNNPNDDLVEEGPSEMRRYNDWRATMDRVNEEDLGDNNPDDDFLPRKKPRQKTSAPKSSSEPEKQVGEDVMEMHLYTDKIEDMQSIATSVKDSNEVPAMMREVVKIRDDLNRLIRKYTDA